MKILFVAQNLQMGGIQKALVNTLKELAEENDTVELFTFGDGRLQSDVPKSIKIHQGNLLLRLVSTPFAEVRNNKKFFSYIFANIMYIVR